MWRSESARKQRNVQVSKIVLSYIVLLLGAAIKRTNGTQTKWTKQSTKNAKNVESCIGELYAECACKFI